MTVITVEQQLDEWRAQPCRWCGKPQSTGECYDCFLAVQVARLGTAYPFGGRPRLCEFARYYAPNRCQTANPTRRDELGGLWLCDEHAGAVAAVWAGAHESQP